MNAYKRMVIRQRKWMLYILAIAVLGWGFTEYTQIFQSLMLGLAGGFYNLFLMQKKIDLLGERVSKNEKTQSLGMISRFAVAALIAVISLRFPDQFNIYVSVMGLMTPYLVIMIDFIFYLKDTSTSTTKRGE